MANRIDNLALNGTFNGAPSSGTLDLSAVDVKFPLAAYNASDFPVTSSATFTDVTGMAFTLPAGTYDIEVFSTCLSGSGAGGFRLMLLLSNSCAYNFNNYVNVGNNSSTNLNVQYSSGTGISLGAATTDQFFVFSKGSLVATSSTVVQMQFAQNVSDGTACNYSARSFMTARKIA